MALKLGECPQSVPPGDLSPGCPTPSFIHIPIHSFIPPSSYHTDVLSTSCMAGLVLGWTQRGPYPKAVRVQTHIRLQHAVVRIVMHLSPSCQGSPKEDMGDSCGVFRDRFPFLNS